MPHKTIDGITSSVIPYYVNDGGAFVLLGRRGAKSKAFADAWCLVGGFLDPGSESLQQCAARELKEETGIEVSADSMKLVTIQSDPERDPQPLCPTVDFIRAQFQVHRTLGPAPAMCVLHCIMLCHGSHVR